MPGKPASDEIERLERQRKVLKARTEQIESELRNLDSQIKKVTGRITLPPGSDGGKPSSRK